MHETTLISLKANSLTMAVLGIVVPPLEDHVQEHRTESENDLDFHVDMNLPDPPTLLPLSPVPSTVRRDGHCPAFSPHSIPSQF